MRHFLIIVLLGTTCVLFGCGRQVDVKHVEKNPDGLTVYDPISLKDARAPLDKHKPFRTEYCPICKCWVIRNKHRHFIDTYCPVCDSRVLQDPKGDPKNNKVSPEHVHKETALCPICYVEAHYDYGNKRFVDHHCFKTAYCKKCKREAAIDYKTKGNYRIREEHVHGRTQYCPICDQEAKLGFVGHFRNETQYCERCDAEVIRKLKYSTPEGREVVKWLHKCGETRYNPIFRTEVPINPIPSERFPEGKLALNHNVEIHEIRKNEKGQSVIGESLGTVEEIITREYKALEKVLQAKPKPEPGKEPPSGE